jgi:hypothetical protein
VSENIKETIDISSVIITVTVITVGGGVVLAGDDGTAGGTSVVSRANKQDRATLVPESKYR